MGGIYMHVLREMAAKGWICQHFLRPCERVSALYYSQLHGGMQLPTEEQAGLKTVEMINRMREEGSRLVLEQPLSDHYRTGGWTI